MMAVCPANSMLPLNDEDEFVSMIGVGDGIKGRSGVEETDLCGRNHVMRMAQTQVRKTAIKQNGTSKLGLPAQQFAAAQRQGGLTVRRKESAEGVSRNSSVSVPKAATNGDGGVARRAQSFSVKRGPATQTGSRLVQPGFKTGKQFGAATGMRSARNGHTGSVDSLVSNASGGSGDVPSKALQIVEGHFSAEPPPTEVSKTGHKVPSLRSKSVGRGTAKTADKGSSLKSTGDSSRTPLQQQRQCHSDNEGTAIKPAPGRDRTRATALEVPSGNRTGRTGPAPVAGSRGPSRAESSCNSPSNARPSSLHVPPTVTTKTSGIPRPKQPQQSHLARIASRLASLVTYHVGGGGGSSRVARSGPVAATEKQALLSSKSSTPSRPISPSSQVSTAAGAEKSMSPVILRHTLTSPPGSKIPRPTSSLASSRRSSAATSPEPERHPVPTSGLEQAEQRASRGASPDMSTRRSSTPSIPALAEKSFKAVSPQRHSTPSKERKSSDSSLLAAKSRPRFDSTISETGQSDDNVLPEERLEGQIPIDPDEYRRLQQEVKMVKTVLLKLRRELQGEQSASSPVGVKQERDEALATLECVRADLQRRDDTITQLSFELEAARSQSKSLRGEVEELGRLREELIDRVERLHAEKHKLEDRVVQAEQHAQSLLSGDFEDLLCESLEASSVKEERQQGTVDSTVLSDGGKGENSDPESEAVVTSTDAIN